MRIGFMSQYDPERIEFAARHGFGAVELTVTAQADFLPGRDGWESKADDVAGAYQAADLRISCIGGFYGNHMSDDAKEAEGNAEMVRKTIALAQRIGVGVVAGFAGRIMDRPLEESLPRFKQIWGQHAKLAEDHGVKIALEHCPMGYFGTPSAGNNMICTPPIWREAFGAVDSDALGLEWDPSHLVGLFIDPIANLREFGSRVYHVHAKDAKVNHDILARDGLWAPGATEHCFPGLGDTDWGVCIKELIRQGYDSDLNIEGWHDAVYRDHDDGRKLEDKGLLIARNHLAQFV